MSDANFDKVMSEVTLKVAYSGSDVKLDIKDIKLSAAVSVEGIAKRRIKKDKDNAQDKPVEVDLSGLIDPSKVSWVFVSLKLAPNQKIAQPILVSHCEFQPKCSSDPKVLSISGDSTVTFFDAKDQDNGYINFTNLARKYQLPKGSGPFCYNPNDQEVFIDVAIGYREKSKEAGKQKEYEDSSDEDDDGMAGFAYRDTNK